jgi:ABC-2 type transport system ATP-binding protein
VLTVGDQSFQRKSSEKIEQFRREGRTIVVVSHGLGAVQQLCKEVVWLEKGHLKMRGPAAEVIAAYTGESYVQHTAKDADLRERWGTEEARIDSVLLTDMSGQAIERVETNAAMRVTTRVTAQMPLRAPVIKIYISKLDGTIVWSTTSQRANSSLGNIPESVTATIDIPHLPLLEGTYFISVACTDATGTTEYDHCQNWVRFDVHQNDLFEEGLVAVPSSWNIERHAK